MDFNLKPTVVLDIGSGYTKAGLADSEYPSCIIPTAVSFDEACGKKELFFQEDLNYPVEHGIIKNFDHIQTILEYVFSKELDLNPEDHPFLLTQPPKNPQADKLKLAELLFERFYAPALYEEVHPVLTFYSSGRPAGLIVESGHGLTSVVPILSGYAISEAILRLDVGGGDVDRYLAKLLDKVGCGNSVTLEEARKIKEELCFVSPTADRSCREEKGCTMPDGRIILLEPERSRATNPLFQPSLVEQYDCLGIHEMIFQSIFKCGLDLRREFASNIILSGGNTLFNGLDDRLKTELEARVPRSMKIDVVADKDRKFFVWRGGSILGSLSTFSKNICVSKHDYEEHGPSIIKKKFMNGL